MSYIVISKGAKPDTCAAVAPKGYHRLADGTLKRDGSPSPEMGPIHLAHKFSTHRKAALTASTLAYPEIREINY